MRILTLDVSKKEMNTVRIDVSDLASGTYLVRIKGIEGSSKFIIQE